MEFNKKAKKFRLSRTIKKSKVKSAKKKKKKNKIK